jgi:hypothetical protein
VPERVVERVRRSTKREGVHGTTRHSYIPHRDDDNRVSFLSGRHHRISDKISTKTV